MLLQSVVVSSQTKHILVTGGAGYIGSQTTQVLLDRGYDVTVVDDLSRGYRRNVPPERLRVMNLRDTDGLAKLMMAKPVAAVIHFAAYIAVGESNIKPEIYFENNVSGSLSLFTAMVRAGVKRLVFSSTAAVYGMPASSPITEEFPYAPINPYGESKVMVEKLLHWFDVVHQLRSVCLRYFNASGADPAGRLGEEHEPETHLIPLMMRAIKTGKPVTIFGDDYPTPDGTCIRDYIHVCDLADAHIAAVESLLGGGPSDRFNVGTGVGHSIREVLEATEAVTGKKVPYVMGPRRDGDPAALVADSSKLQRILGWKPRYTNLRDVVATAWEFEQKHATERV
jgi:UDP-glucose-4-epimerase GalE